MNLDETDIVITPGDKAMNDFDKGLELQIAKDDILLKGILVVGNAALSIGSGLIAHYYDMPGLYILTGGFGYAAFRKFGDTIENLSKYTKLLSDYITDSNKN